ncbi:MAG: hypothetical protein R3B70_46215 [Polyangiaceae bacterium]
MRWVAPVLAMLAALGGACTQTGPDVKGPAAAGTAKVVPAAKGPGSEWVSARFVEVRSLGQGVSMLLPEDAGWAIADPTNGWFVAQHAGTSTQIVVRWIATDGLANRARCEKRARDLLPLPEREGATIVERQRVDLPSGFDTVMEVGIEASEPGRPITGFVMAIGGWAKRCFVYALTTSAQGSGAEEAVGDRLALFVERSFLKLKVEDETKATVPREKPPIGK